MHQSPAVAWRVTRSRFAGLTVLALCVLVLLVHAAWWYTVPDWTAARAGSAAFALAACLYAVIEWRAAPAGQMTWDGRCWSWAAGGAAPVPGRVRVALDLQAVMLVRLDVAPARHLWCWVSRSDDPALWLPLRRALHAGAGHRDDPVLAAVRGVPPV